MERQAYAAIRAGVKDFIFSSTAAVYGNPQVLPVVESAELRPENPYGESKLQVERMLPWYDQAFGLRWVALRYFNAAGAASVRDPHAVDLVPVGETGEDLVAVSRRARFSASSRFTAAMTCTT